MVLSLHQFGQQRGASHGGNASLGEKSDFLDAAIGDSQCQLQDIAAGRVFDLGGGVGICHFAGIARMLEVIENLGRVHRRRL